MSVVYNNRYNEYVKSIENDITLKGCFVCFEDDGKSVGVCRHCLLGVCKHSDCVDVFPHLDNSEYLICTDCKHTIEKKLKALEYTDEDLYEEKLENQYKQKILKQVQEEKLGYENALLYIKLLQVVQ
jgi:hypothetical protein